MVNSIGNGAASALSAYVTLLNNTAGNIANMNTENYKPVETTMQTSSGGGVDAVTSRSASDSVDLSKEIVALITAETGFKASIAALKTSQEMQKSLIDIIA